MIQLTDEQRRKIKNTFYHHHEAEKSDWEEMTRDERYWLQVAFELACIVAANADYSAR